MTFAEECQPLRVLCQCLRHNDALKKWYLTPMCFVRGFIFTALDVVISPLLSTKKVDLITAVSPPQIFVTVAISKNIHHIVMNSRIAWLRAVYSALVVLRTISF